MTTALTEIFWSNFITICSGLVLAMIGVVYKSKCRLIKCCGCEIQRDTEAEENIDNRNIEEGKDNG